MKQQKYVLVFSDGTDRLFSSDALPWNPPPPPPPNPHDEGLLHELFRTLHGVLLASVDGGSDKTSPTGLVDALAQLGAFAVPFMRQRLDHGHPIEKQAAAVVLERMGWLARPALPALRHAAEMLNHVDPHDPESAFRKGLREAIGRAVAAIQRSNVLPHLLMSGWVAVRETPAGTHGNAACFLVLLERDESEPNQPLQPAGPA